MTAGARRHGILALSCVALVTLALFARLLYADFQREKQSWVGVTQSHQVLREVAAIMSAVDDARSAQRQYLLNGDTRYAGPVRKAMDQAVTSCRAVRRLTVNNAIQQSRLDLLDSLVSARFGQLRSEMTLRDRQGTTPPLELMHSPACIQINEEMRAVFHAIEDEERDLLRQRSATAEGQSRRTRWVLGAGIGSLFLLLIAAGAAIVRDMRARDRAREGARKSEQRLRLALDSANAGAWEWDLRTNENIWSDELWKLYGLEINSCRPSYEAWREVVHPDDREAAERGVTAAAQAGSELNIEFRIRKGEGKDRWLLSRAKPVRGATGSVECFIGIAVDITQRKRAEEAMRERERVLRRFTEAAPVAIAMFDCEMRYLAVSGRFREDYHLGELDPTGKCHYEVFPEIPDRWKQIHRRCLAGAVESHPGDRFIRADGLVQWVRWEIQPWRELNGEIGGIILFSEDRTRQEIAEQELLKSETRLRLAMAGGGLGSWEHRFAGNTIDWDERSRQMFGAASEGPVAFEEAMSRFHPEDRPRVEAVMAKSLADPEGKPFHVEYRVVWDDGSVHWLSSEGRLHFEGEGEARKPERIVGVNMDITERKQVEMRIRSLNAELEQRVRRRTEELQNANRELEAFAYSVSHDLRAPLRGIDGWSLALAEDYAGQLDERAQQYITRVRSETQRMGHLIDDMLKLSRVSFAEMNDVAVDLSALARGIAERLKESHAGRRIEFQIEQGMATRGDARLLEIALGNLMENAVKFTGPREVARIDFETVQNGDGPGFRLRDNGVGFDMAYAGALFGAFQRLHRSSEFSGSGIGLAIVQRVIHRHRGRIRAEAERDRGAAFYFTIGSEE